MRGALGDVLDELDGGGIIPADAGSTLSARQTRTFQKDHPRGCGEHSDLPWYKLFSTGSSPRMRGAPFIHAFRQIDPWIIPADAGSTSFQIVALSCNRDHPRGCGEHCLYYLP